MLKCVTDTGSDCHCPGGLRGKSSWAIMAGGPLGRRGQTSGGGGNVRPANGDVLLLGKSPPEKEDALAFETDALGNEALSKGARELEEEDSPAWLLYT